MAADPGRELDRLAQRRRGPGQDVRLADDAAVERGDDPGRQVVDVDEAEPDVVDRPIAEPTVVGEPQLLADRRVVAGP